MKEIDFVLNDPVEYHNKGQSELLNKVVMTAPTAAMVKYTAPLKQIFMECFTDQITALKDLPVSEIEKAREEAKKDNNDFDSNGVSMVLSRTKEPEKLHQAFKELCCAGVIKTPNGEKIALHTLDKFLLDDYERLLGEYLANFILGSMMKKA
jgi:hypothetical protein